MKPFQILLGFLATIAGLLYPRAATCFGTSYPIPNSTTFAELQSQAGNNAAEQLWVKGLLLRTYGTYAHNPFGDNMIGTAKPGDKMSPGKPIIRFVDTEKVHGTTINIPLSTGYGQPAVLGNNVRVGQEGKIRTNNMQLVVGRAWFGMAYDAIARDQTMIGGLFDEEIKAGLKELHAKKRSDDIMMRWRQAAATTKGARNLILPDTVSSIATLKSGNVLDTSMLDKGSQILPSFGARPVNLIRDVAAKKTDYEMPAYMLLTPSIVMRNLLNDPTYTTAIQRGGERGMRNPNFTGEVQNWNGLEVYRWVNVDHGNKGPVGSPLLPRALLGVDTASVTTSTVLQGGGYNYTATDVPLPNYFEHFEGAYYAFHNGDVIAQNTGTTRYIKITNLDGSYGVFPYTTVGTTSTDANTLLVSGTRITVSDANSGTQTATFTQGASIEQCNVLGVAYGYSCFMGADTVAVGDGSIDGKKVDSALGRRTFYEAPHGTSIAIGAEAVHGSATVIRQDGYYPNFLLAQTALPSSVVVQ